MSHIGDTFSAEVSSLLRIAFVHSFPGPRRDKATSNIARDLLRNPRRANSSVGRPVGVFNSDDNGTAAVERVECQSQQLAAPFSCLPPQSLALTFAKLAGVRECHISSRQAFDECEVNHIHTYYPLARAIDLCRWL